MGLNMLDYTAAQVVSNEWDVFGDMADSIARITSQLERLPVRQSLDMENEGRIRRAMIAPLAWRLVDRLHDGIARHLDFWRDTNASSRTLRPRSSPESRLESPVVNFLNRVSKHVRESDVESVQGHTPWRDAPPKEECTDFDRRSHYPSYYGIMTPTSNHSVVSRKPSRRTSPSTRLPHLASTSVNSARQESGKSRIPRVLDTITLCCDAPAHEERSVSHTLSHPCQYSSFSSRPDPIASCSTPVSMRADSSDSRTSVLAHHPSSPASYTLASEKISHSWPVTINREVLEHSPRRSRGPLVLLLVGSIGRVIDRTRLASFYSWHRNALLIAFLTAQFKVMSSRSRIPRLPFKASALMTPPRTATRAQSDDLSRLMRPASRTPSGRPITQSASAGSKSAFLGCRSAVANAARRIIDIPDDQLLSLQTASSLMEKGGRRNMNYGLRYGERTCALSCPAKSASRRAVPRGSIPVFVHAPSMDRDMIKAPQPPSYYESFSKYSHN